MYQIWQYFKFLFSSTNQHGVHSPFVYQLVTQCFYNRRTYKAYQHLNTYRKQLYRNLTQLQITDFGAGSRRFTKRQRRVCTVAKNSGITKKRAQLLFRLTQYFKANTILELGTCLGMGTHALALANPQAKMSTVEGCPTLSQFAKNQIKVELKKNCAFINSSFKAYLEQLTPQTLDLIYLDGHHDQAATQYYFMELLPYCHNDTLLIVDDIYWSKGMTQAWQFIKEHPQTTVTVDTFFWGLVFFRKEQAKEHFKIRLF